MEFNVILFAAAITFLGVASGLEIISKKEYLPIIGFPRLLASVAGIVDIILIVLAFFIFPLKAAFLVVLGGAFGTALLSKVLAPNPEPVILTTVLGSAALIASFIL